MTPTQAHLLDFILNSVFWGLWIALFITAVEALFPVLQGRRK
jgi:hypothetical protein